VIDRIGPTRAGGGDTLVDHGQTERIVGGILFVGAAIPGLIVQLLLAGVLYLYPITTEDYGTPGPSDVVDSTPPKRTTHYGVSDHALLSFAALAGAAYGLQGAGAKVYATGVAQQSLRDPKATGVPKGYVAAWIMAFVSVALPTFALSRRSEEHSMRRAVAISSTLLGVAASTTFIAGAFYPTMSPGERADVIPTVALAPDAQERPVVTFGLRWLL